MNPVPGVWCHALEEARYEITRANDATRELPSRRSVPGVDYSEPWFFTHKVLRGGCWATRGRLLRNTWRNFYPPDRRDVWAGFRTCALQSDGAPRLG